jgi:hypothetical protein
VVDMTEAANLPEPSYDEADGGGGSRKALMALVPVLLLALGLSVLVAIWWRRGGPRNVITDLAEQGAVRLADAMVDEVLGAA